MTAFSGSLKLKMIQKKFKDYVDYSLLLFDKVLERVWEGKNFYLRKKVSDGELNAILRRNGYHGLHRFIINQKNGAFGRRNFIPGNRDAVVESILQGFPGEGERIVSVADDICNGKFSLLGSGLVDMRRFGCAKGYKLDWVRDPITGHKYKRVFSPYRWNPLTMRKGDADVKGLWELTRCQHFAILGQAYWITNDEKYAECYARTIADFIRANPVGMGVHWACNMDVGLRVVNWLIGLSFFQGSKHLTYRWWKEFIKSMVGHGRHILNNLEFGTLDGKIIVSNHGLANLLGLYWLALNFPALDAGCVWRGVSEKALEEQIRIQILEDGGCFESSVPYHRLVVEMFLSAYALSRHLQITFSKGYRDRLVKGLFFIKSLRQKNGRLPQIGDADNGRAHIFYQYGCWEEVQENMDHLLVAGASVLGCDELKENVDRKSYIEGLFWRDAGDSVVEAVHGEKLEYPILFEKAGVAVLSAGPSYIAISNGECGTFGIGNHKHNDQMAIEWSVDGNPIFVDAGSYTYTRDPKARNEFRSTSIHNTVMLDGQEQNTLDPNALFRLQQKGEPYWKGIKKSEDGNLSGVWAGHTGYKTLEGSPFHERRLTLDSAGTVVIDDIITSGRDLKARFHFLLYPGVKASMHSGRICFDNGVIKVYMHSDRSLVWKLGSAWYSPGYGVKVETKSIYCDVSFKGGRVTTILSYQVEDNIDIPSYMRLADKLWECCPC